MDKFLFQTKCMSVFLGLWLEIWYNGKVYIKCESYDFSSTRLLISNVLTEQSQK